MKKRSKKEACAIRNLDRAVKISRTLLKRLNETKAPGGGGRHMTRFTGVHHLSFVQFSSAIRVAKSMFILLRRQRTFEARVLNRIVLESVGSIYLFMTDHANRDMLVTLFYEQFHVDKWEIIERERVRFGNKTIEQWVAENPSVAALYRGVEKIDKERKIRRGSVDPANARDWPPPTWRDISIERKVQSIIEHHEPGVAENLKVLMSNISVTMGNSAAHSGPFAMSAIATVDREGAPEYPVDIPSKVNPFFSTTAVATEAAIYLLLATNFLATQFHLSDEFDPDLNRLTKSIRRNNARE